MKLRTGDLVQVIAGKDRGKQAKISRAHPARDTLIVEGVNTAKRHQKQTSQTMQGGIIDKDMPIHVSNVMIVCPECGPTKIGARIDGDGNKFRICRKCGGEL